MSDLHRVASNRAETMPIATPADRQPTGPDCTVHPLTSQRRLIWDAMRLTRSFFLNHQVFQVRFDAVEESRDEQRQIGQPAPSYVACVMYAIGQVLPRHPWLNAYLTPFPRRIVRFQEVDICYTVECLNPDGTPYVSNCYLRNASQLTLGEIHRQLSATREAADSASSTAGQHPYARKSTVSRWLNYTFRCARFPAKVREVFGTVGFTSVGRWGAAMTTPLSPRTLTFSLGAVTRQPLVYGNEVKPGLAAWLTLTYDHRIADGSQVARLGSEMASFLSEFPGAEMRPTAAASLHTEPAPGLVKAPEQVPTSSL